MFVLYLAGVVVGFVIYVGELVYNKVVLKGVDPNTGVYPSHPFTSPYIHATIYQPIYLYKLPTHPPTLYIPF